MASGGGSGKDPEDGKNPIPALSREPMREPSIYSRTVSAVRVADSASEFAMTVA